MKGPGWRGAYGYVEISEFVRFHLVPFRQIIPMARTNKRTIHSFVCLCVDLFILVLCLFLYLVEIL